MNKDIEILVVEDSPTQAEQLKYVLEQQGYCVSVANNGKEALALIGKRKPKVVISDIIMPEMDGYQLCQQIKAGERLKDIPVILVTALSDPKDIIKGIECGADNFIVKPYDEKYLLYMIQHVLANQELHRGESAQMEFFFRGQKYFITADRLQILNLLLSMYETAVQKNLELIKAQDELRALNEQLEEKVEERTKALSEEITERKRAGEALKESEERFRSLVETTSDWIWEVDEEAVYIYASPKVNDILGYEPEEVVGKTPFDLMPEDEAKRVTNLFLDISRERKPFERLENVNQHKDGQLVVLESSGVPILDANGKFLGYRGVDRNITERKRAEETFRRQQEHFRTVIENIFKFVPESILVFTEKMNLFKQNKAFDDLLLKYSAKLGYTKQELSEIIIEQIKKKIAEGEDKEIKIAKKRQ